MLLYLLMRLGYLESGFFELQYILKTGVIDTHTLYMYAILLYRMYFSERVIPDVEIG